MAEHEAELERARELMREEETAGRAHQDSIGARDDAVRAYYAAAKGSASDNELARRLGMNPSTFRSIINRAPRARR